MVKKKAKKLVSLVLSLMFIVSAAAIISSADTIDKSWTFIFTTTTRYTADREKANTTKIYFKRSDSNTGYTFTAKPYAKPVSGYVDCSHGISRTISVSSSPYYLTNYVREDGYLRACVQGYSSTAFSASGVWSPDNSSGI